jgi:type 1 glutamine amidotransferase
MASQNLLLILGLVVVTLALANGQQCNKQTGKDINAPNLSSRNNQPESACCGICQNTAGCRAYAWNNYEGGTCWLKSSSGPVVDKGDASVGIIEGGQDPFRIVAFWRGTWDVAHISFANEANRFLPTIQAQHGFTYTNTRDWSLLNDNYLANVDVVLFLDDGIPSASGEQRAALQRFVERGGGYMGFHVSAFTTNANGYSWYHNTFLGSGNFWKNTWKPTPAVLQVEKRDHPSTINLPATFTSQHNEWYAWSNDLRTNPNIDILMSIHPSSYPLGTNPGETWYEGYYPVVWTNKNYRMLYVNMGHNDIDYSNGNADLSATFGGTIQNQFFTDAFKWLAGRTVEKQTPAINPLFKAFAK